MPGENRAVTGLPLSRNRVKALTHLTPADVGAVCRIIGECGELWADPEAWQTHLLAEISKQIRMPIGMTALVSDFALGKSPRIYWATEHGWPDPAQHAIMFRIRAEQTPEAFGFAPVDRRFRGALQPESVTTRARQDLLARREWHRSVAYSEYFAPAGLREVLYSAAELPDGRHHLLSFGGSHAADDHAREFVHLLHLQVAPLLGRRLATSDQICLHGLTPRQRAVLEAALRGLSEKEIADALGLRVATVNEHLQHIYRHFGVNSRAALLAYFVRREPASGPPR